MDLTITLTDLAAEQLKETIGENPTHLRVWVMGGGCSGLSYGMALDDNEPETGDIIVEDRGVKILTDSLSAQYLNGSVIDYTEDVLGGGFKIENPNAARSCGCGNSFSADNDGIPALNNGKGCGGCGSN
jgi:iron-sulfur cluster assembly protein